MEKIRIKDLYEYMNGQWLSTHVIPDDRGIDGSFLTLRDKSEADIHDIITKDSSRAGVCYRSFMDLKAINAAGASVLRPDLDKIKAVTTVADLTKLMGQFDRSGFVSPVSYYIAKAADSEIVAPYVSQAGLGLPDEAYYRLDSHKEVFTAYRAHVERMLGFVDEEYLFGQTAANAADIIVDLESELAKGHWDVVASRDATKTYNPTRLADVAEKVRSILTASGVDCERVIVCQPSYIDHLEGMLDAGHLDAFKLYLVWGVINSSAGYLSEEIAKANFDFFGTKLSGATTQRDRWKRAVGFAESAVGEELGKAYVKEHFPASSKKEMLELVGYLTKAYRESISDLDWMTEETKKKALIKLEKFRAKIGYPDVWRSYEGLTVKEGGENLYSNVRAVCEFNHDYELAKAGKPADRDEWFCTPQTVNAFYNPVVNDITFPAAILQWPFYSPESDAAENFGGIGAVIGHEIGHGFDDQGSKFDGEGNLNSWWTPKDREAFEQLTEKLVGQFNGRVPKVLSDNNIDSEGVNGSFTLGENIGDLGGLGIAVLAYKNYLADRGLDFDSAPVTTTDASGADPDLEGRKLTGLQRLFLSWARVWRTLIRPELASQYLAIDPHAPAEFRCNIIAANIKEFYDAFDVDADAPMFIPEADRVTIW